MRSPFIDDAIDNNRNIKDFVVECACSAEIIWLRLPKEWTEAEVNQQITAAKTWFKKYCIDLAFKEFALDPTLPKHDEKKKELDDLFKKYEIQASQIPKGKTQSGIEDQLKAIQETVEDIHSLIIEREKTKIEQQKKKAKGEKSPLVVLFLDEWYPPLPGEGIRSDRISANHRNFPLIGLDRYDRASSLLLVHELAHGLRRVVNPPKKGVKILDKVFEQVGEPGVPPKFVIPYNTKCVDKFIKTNQVKKLAPRFWDDHCPSGVNQERAMLFIDRFTAFQPYQYNQNHVFTVLEYLTILAAGYVSCVEGCDEKQEMRTPFYLTDLLLDLSRVVHLTPGLRFPFLKNVPFPAEFTAVVREEMPNLEMLSFPALVEESPNSFSTNEVSIEQSRIFVPPLEMPAPSAFLSGPEVPAPPDGVNVFYLPDLTLDMTGVAHMTPGFREPAFSNLSLLAFNLPVLRQIRQTLLLKKNSPDEELKRSPDEKIMAFGELEMDATFGFAKAGLVDTIFNFVEENINPQLPKLPKFLKLPLGEAKITKEQVQAAVDTVSPKVVIDFTCTGSCEYFDSIQIGQQSQELHGSKRGGTTIPVIDVSLFLRLDAVVTTAPVKVINSCITEEELDFRRKSKEALEAMQEFQEAVGKKAKGEKVELPARPEFPKPPKERSKSGKQVQQDFIIKWSLTIEFSLLGIENTRRLYTQTVSRYSPCCPIPIPAVPIPPSAVPEGEEEKEDDKKGTQKEFFLAGHQDLGEIVRGYSPAALPGNIAEEIAREEAAMEEQEKPVFVTGLEEIALSAEALATRFMAADIATIVSQPIENTAAPLSSREDLFPFRLMITLPGTPQD
ncbi:hypothetical protein [Nitrosomonas communis]|uniref:hypothetical protein n=1 Tax=Nitrosomonas communis TaxID=44574 RepID=UPI0026EFE1D8|nr:hypothetical protein [Nitrosomonas communis]MCO6429125.1 hypothetical protein [Nitrosomonas communis]